MTPSLTVTALEALDVAYRHGLVVGGCIGFIVGMAAALCILALFGDEDSRTNAPSDHIAVTPEVLDAAMRREGGCYIRHLSRIPRPIGPSNRTIVEGVQPKQRSQPAVRDMAHNDPDLTER